MILVKLEPTQMGEWESTLIPLIHCISIQGAKILMKDNVIPWKTLYDLRDYKKQIKIRRFPFQAKA